MINDNSSIWLGLFNEWWFIIILYFLWIIPSRTINFPTFLHIYFIHIHLRENCCGIWGKVNRIFRNVFFGRNEMIGCNRCCNNFHLIYNNLWNRKSIIEYKSSQYISTNCIWIDVGEKHEQGLIEERTHLACRSICVWCLFANTTNNS